MADKKRLGKLLQQRATPREGVKPVNLYEPAPAPAAPSQQTGKEAKKQTSKEENILTREPAKKQKFGTWLTPGTIRRLKVLAAIQGKYDHEIVEAALIDYLNKHKEG